MDPGGSDLESSLPQAENPCLIVEDSQPDSVALEDDPDSSYRALLSRRLSNLQPTSHSPVLELISSPSKGRCPEGQGQAEKSNSVPEADRCSSNRSLAAAEHSQVFEVCSLPNTKSNQEEDMESGADSTTNCAQTEEGTSQFGLLELSESQGLNIETQSVESGDEDVEATPADLQPPDREKPANQSGSKSSSRASDNQDDGVRRPEVSSSSASVPQRREGRELSVQAILHSQVSESVGAEEEEDEEMMSSQDDLFDGERSGSKVDSTVAEHENPRHHPTCTPARTLRLLHLSGQGTLVQESLSQQSVDFVAATQDNLSQTPHIVPNSPTGQEDEPDFNEPSKKSPGTPNDQPQKGQEEPMDVGPARKPTASNEVSQNSPSSVLEKSLSLPTQPEFSHDVFVPTPSLESGVSSRGPGALKKKEATEQSPSAILGAEASKKPDGGQSSQVASCFQLELDTENSVFDKKTQAFAVGDDEDSQATQIEEIRAPVGDDKRDSVPSDQNEKTHKSSIDCGPNKAANLQGISKEPNQKAAEKECSFQKLSSQPSKGQNGQIHDSAAKPQEISNPVASHQTDEVGLVKDLTLSSCSQSKEQAGKLVSTTPVSSPSQPQSALLSHRSPSGEREQEAENSQRLSQPMSQSHRLDLSISDTKNTDYEEFDEGMDEGEVQSTSRTPGSGFGLALPQSQVGPPEPMEDGRGVAQPVGSKGKDSLSVVVLEESERVSPERTGIQRSPAFRSSSQPVEGSPKEKSESGRKVPSSQPNNSGQNLQVATGTAANDSQASDKAASGEVLNVTNKSLSDSSGDLPFHFTLPRGGELIGPAVSATPPHVRQLKNTPLHSTPIETSALRERTEVNISRETTMAASEISVEESGEDLTAQGGDNGKLSLRMKVVTPVEEGSSGPERFSLQKPSLSDEEGSVSKATAVAKAVSSPPSIFARVREVHRQLQVEDEEMEPSDLSLRPLSQTAPPIGERPEPPPGPLGNGTPEQSSQRPNGTAVHSEPRTSAAKAHEAPSTSGQAPREVPAQRAVSQQTSLDLSSARSLLSKKAVSQQTSFDASGPQLPSDRGEPVTPTRSQSGPSHRRHVRTIQEVRTTITRIITDVYYEDGREVDRKVVEETEEPVVDRCVMDSDISPSRTGSSMTSGDLADVSSLSSKAASHFSSSGTSSGGPASGRMADFVMPFSRGAKSGSPRRGGKQAVGAELAGIWGSLSAAPLSPRGHGRRGRPPSRAPLSRGGRSAQRAVSHGPAASSSEDEQLAGASARVPSSGLDALHATSPEIGAGIGGGGGGGSSFVGLRVMAKWSSNSFFYSGTITRDLGENRFRLLFDDNQECEAQGKDILLCDPIPLEAEVTALTEEEYFNTGIVKAHKRQGAELLYCVEKDGQSTWYIRTAVILTMDQGNRLREQYGLGPYEAPTPQNMASDISLDNLVEGKRRRRGNGTGPATPNSSSTNSPRTPGKRKLASSTEDERTPAKRGRRGGGAKSGLRLAPCDTSGSGAELPSDPSDLLVTHGPLPESASLFMGFVFMLTASFDHDDKSDNQTTSDGEEEYVPAAPYNKRYTESQLEAGGGMILPQFNEEQCKAAYQSLLIADQHCRTRTYLLCVAGGVPCVSQMWVRDCCQEKKLMNYRNYLLPAGVGPEQRIIEWHTRCSPFKALKVLLLTEDRVDLWTSLLTMCGAAKVQQHKKSNNSSEISAEGLDLVISASPCPAAEVLKCAVAASTPVVSLEWLVHCVICGERLAYDAQPEYHHDYTS